MKEAEYAQRATAEKERLYRTALLYLGGEAAALDAVDEAVYRGLLACGRLRRPGIFLHLAHPDPAERLCG